MTRYTIALTLFVAIWTACIAWSLRDPHATAPILIWIGAWALLTWWTHADKGGAR